MNPSIPAFEDERLEELEKLQILYTPSEERFDRISRLCKDVFDVEIAELNLIDEDVQWTKSSTEKQGAMCDREDSFCAHTMLEEQTVVIPDAREDERFQNNPFVTGEPGIRFYMSHPVYSPKDVPLGTLCIYDTKPRTVSQKEQQMLQDFAGIVESELQNQKTTETNKILFDKLSKAERQSRIDKLTNVWNRRAIDELLEREIARATREHDPVTVMMMDVNDFKEINDTFGHQAGDHVLKEIATRTKKILRSYDFVGRYGGDEFLVLLKQADNMAARRIAQRIAKSISSPPISVGEEDRIVNTSVGVTISSPPSHPDQEKLVALADEEMYHAKQDGKDDVSFREM